MGHYLLLAPILLVAAVTIHDDLRHGRIYNQRLIQGLTLGGMVYLVLLLIEASGAPATICPGPLPEGAWHWSFGVLLNLSVGLAVAVLLWLMGVWAAGDAKLFVLYAFLVPPSAYGLTWLQGFPALPMLVNTFALVFVVLAVDLLRTTVPAALRTLGDPPRRTAALRAIPPALPRVVPLLLAFTAMFAGIRALREASREGLEPLLEVGDFTMFLILFAIFRPLARAATTRWGGVIFTVLALSALTYLGSRHGLASLPRLLLPSVLAVLLILFARAYPALGSVTRRSRVGSLEPGMLLGKESLLILRAREEKELEELGDDAPAADEEVPGTTSRPTRIGSLTADGLSAEQIRYVRTRYDDDEELLVERTLPFSPLLAAGALITFAIGGSLLTLVLGLAPAAAATP